MKTIILVTGTGCASISIFRISIIIQRKSEILCRNLSQSKKQSLQLGLVVVLGFASSLASQSIQGHILDTSNDGIIAMKMRAALALLLPPSYHQASKHRFTKFNSRSQLAQAKVAQQSQRGGGSHPNRFLPRDDFVLLSTIQLLEFVHFRQLSWMNCQISKKYVRLIKI